MKVLQLQCCDVGKNCQFATSLNQRSWSTSPTKNWLIHSWHQMPVNFEGVSVKNKSSNHKCISPFIHMSLNEWRRLRKNELHERKRRAWDRQTSWHRAKHANLNLIHSTLLKRESLIALGCLRRAPTFLSPQTATVKINHRGRRRRRQSAKIDVRLNPLFNNQILQVIL